MLLSEPPCVVTSTNYRFSLNVDVSIVANIILKCSLLLWNLLSLPAHQIIKNIKFHIMLQCISWVFADYDFKWFVKDDMNMHSFKDVHLFSCQCIMSRWVDFNQYTSSYNSITMRIKIILNLFRGIPIFFFHWLSEMTVM